MRALAFAVVVLAISAAGVCAGRWQVTKRQLQEQPINGSRRMGVNYGRVADNLPPPAEAVVLMLKLGVGSVRIFDSDPKVLAALANTSLQVLIGVRNSDIADVASSPESGQQWVQSNVLPFYPATEIIGVDVGNEILSHMDLSDTWQKLVPAMRNIQAALAEAGLAGKIAVSTACGFDVLASSYPPSAGIFRSDIADTIMHPLLQFLNDTASPFHINIYPYLTWSFNQQEIPLQYALFNANQSITSMLDGGLSYNNLLDAQLDALWAAMAKLGFPDIPLVITETGWPTQGGDGAAPDTASVYIQELVKRTLSSQGTPSHPGAFIPAYIFALFNEDQKDGALVEKNWGLLYPDGSPVYSVDLTLSTAGNTTDEPLSPSTPPSSTGQPPSSTLSTLSEWCVAKSSSPDQSLQQALDYICTLNPVFCSPLQDQQRCLLPNTLLAHASFAMNSYWQANKANGGTCDFAGIGQVVIMDPSKHLISPHSSFYCPTQN
ncbi:hypothetical protein L7F22_021070 [Adiantum nelumboides]|nr:hypothetical protein [Adiantum nelumboides]